MNENFTAVVNKILESLACEGYELKSHGTTGSGDLYAVLANEENAVRIECGQKDGLFTLKTGAPDDKASDFVKVQSYLYSLEEGADQRREQQSVANEFLDTLQSKSGKAAAAAAKRQQQKKKRDGNDDESSATFFVNRIPGIMPECREPLLRHKAHYGQLLPRWFCEEVVTKAMHDMLRKGNEKAKCRSFFELLSNMHAQGDLDTKAIIVQVLLGSITNERDVEYVESLISADLKKAWSAGKRWVGRNVKPEKVSAMVKAAQYQAETLDGSRH